MTQRDKKQKGWHVARINYLFIDDEDAAKANVSWYYRATDNMVTQNDKTFYHTKKYNKMAIARNKLLFLDKSPSKAVDICVQSINNGVNIENSLKRWKEKLRNENKMHFFCDKIEYVDKYNPIQLHSFSDFNNLYKENNKCDGYGSDIEIASGPPTEPPLKKRKLNQEIDISDSIKRMKKHRKTRIS
eukprot:UN13136